MAAFLSRPVWLALLLSAAAYGGLGYYVPRSNFYELLGLFTLTFAAYGWLLRQNIPLKTILAAALIFRLLLLVAWPALSDDYFRFLWDGRLLAAGENPYRHVPAFYLPMLEQIPGLSSALYRQLNSPHYFSVYPPICQYIFGVSGWLFPANNQGAVISLRLFILVAELGSCYLIIKLLQHYRQPVRNVGWYALNPLVIVELTGNLHFEAIMIFFLLGSLYLLARGKIVAAGVALGGAIAVKLLPLLLLPFFLARLGGKNFLVFGLMSGLTVLVLFLPFLSPDLLLNIGQSLNLYVQKFEFNASVYYVLRWLGSQFYGYNPIAKIGPLLAALTFFLILYLAHKSRQNHAQKLPVYLLLALSVYFFLATTVHPWYLTTLVALAVFTPYRYALVWSGAAVLSYTTYQTHAYHENLYLTALEYILVFGWLLMEVIRRRRKTQTQPNMDTTLYK